jgi:hypothetical protein
MKILAKILVLIWILTACAPGSTEPTRLPGEESYPNPSYPNPPYPNPSDPTNKSPITLTPAQQAAVTHLAGTLDLPAGQIALITTESVIWPDGCLGVQRPGMMCTQALVEGYRIVLEADGRQYELHTNETGSMVVIASGLDVNSLIESVLIEQLAGNLGLDAGEISVLSNEPVEFSDTCLGVVMQEVMCAEAITPGRVIVLESGGIRYEYHVSDDGTRIQPATLALTWSRDGGIAGFCDRLTVFLSGEVYANQCKLQDGRMGTFANLLTIRERNEFNAWVAEYSHLTLEASDPKGAADAMSLALVFYGSGTVQPSEDVESELFAWAQELYFEVSK